ncbi:MAG TPA: hypothetical protein VM734_00810 [Kofleriaceae bacterium]|nr:hypothetical protein [Kofleriaceae bacterium]
MPDDVQARADETRRISDLVGGDHRAAYELVERQLAVLVLRTQVLLSLSGIVITVTGFSGRVIAQTGTLARYSITGGIVLVLAAALTAFGGVLRLRWLSQALADDVATTIARGLVLRDGKSRYLSIAIVLFGLGFSLYCLAIAQLLMHPG